MITTFILVVALIVEVNIQPRLDFTRDGKVLLWYGSVVRKYIVLFE